MNIEKFKKRRTEILSEMLDNPDKNGIYPTSKCFEELDKLFLGLSRQEAILFGAEFSYNKANPETKMDVPSMVYEMAEDYFDNKYNK